MAGPDLPGGVFSRAFKAFLTDALAVLDLGLDRTRLDALDHFCRFVLTENEVQNLTTLVSPFEMAVKHVLDSLTCVLTGLFDGPRRVIDIGSGAGFPGLPLKIARPYLSMTLLDSSQKRAAFLARAVKSLSLEGCAVECARAEAFGRRLERRESFDVAVVRAVAGLAASLEYGVPVLRVGGSLVSMKGPSVGGELEQARRAAGVLGAELAGVRELTLPLAGDTRNLVVFTKVSRTPPAYPRREGVASRRPLGRTS